MSLGPSTRQAYDELAAGLLQRCRGAAVPVIGINGAQGSGKSTLATYLCRQWRDRYQCRAVALSIDDFYLSHKARQRLAETVHSLLRTRGVPGTHDVAQGLHTLRALRELGAGQSLPVPAFDKASDDCRPQSAWPTVTGPVDLVLLEGWCVGLPAQAPAQLNCAVNALEEQEDADGRWRQWVNDQLQRSYAPWFAQLDQLVFLRVPGWDQVSQWRGQQEQETAARHGAGLLRLLDSAGLARFLMHYQRLTQHALECLPARADVVLRLDQSHAVGSPQWS